MVGVAVIVGAIVWMKPDAAPAVAATSPASRGASNSGATHEDGTGANGQFGYVHVQQVLEQRCTMCHGAQVQMKNVRLDSPEGLKLHAQNVYQQAVVTKIMPMNNSTGITDAERLVIKQWFEAGAKTQ